MKNIYLILVLVLALGCSSQKQLQKSYIGSPLLELKEKFGDPKTVFDRGNEMVYVFEKVSKLKSTEVSQGKMTLDPMVTPSVIKTERFYFTLKEGKVIKARMEEEYER